ncbi:gp16 family protein [Halomonas saccharevitans]|uniref:Mu-like prophage protein gp16 n=1 Tax=Halomonas saccharevitans TaxID=416872 RepID=A0A1I7AGR2_9GAMM|nr:regulatory protein GemA [Halomonas saccharevitans]SFT74127.1 Mu-like prophage protein gp16 [Halomonas saccharevitans]
MISKNKLAQIHIARQQLGLADDEYRAVLARVAGVRSAKDLDGRTAARVLEEFRRLGWKPKAPKRAGRVPNTLNKHEMMGKIEALLSELGASWAYAEAIAKRQTGIERIDWLRTEKQFRGVIAALEAEREKRSRLAAVDRFLAYVGENRESLARRYRLPPGWERDRQLLGRLLDALPEPDKWLSITP